MYKSTVPAGSNRAGNPDPVGVGSKTKCTALSSGTGVLTAADYTLLCLTMSDGTASRVGKSLRGERLD